MPPRTAQLATWIRPCNLDRKVPDSVQVIIVIVLTMIRFFHRIMFFITPWQNWTKFDRMIQGKIFFRFCSGNSYYSQIRSDISTELCSAGKGTTDAMLLVRNALEKNMERKRLIQKCGLCLSIMPAVFNEFSIASFIIGWSPWLEWRRISHFSLLSSGQFNKKYIYEQEEQYEQTNLDWTRFPEARHYWIAKMLWFFSWQQVVLYPPLKSEMSPEADMAALLKTAAIEDIA